MFERLSADNLQKDIEMNEVKHASSHAAFLILQFKKNVIYDVTSSLHSHWFRFGYAKRAKL
jgi:hypothetical protein